MGAIAETVSVPLESLKPYPSNPRNGDIELIADSLRHHGQYRALVVQRSTNRVLAGNHTLHALHETGATEALVHMRDVDDEEAARINLVDNRANDVAKYDDGLLAELLQSLPDLEGTGFDDRALDDLLTRLGQGNPIIGDPDDVPDPPETPVTKLGDLWLLGEHRLLCGDATSSEDVARLMGGSKAVLMATDPPYGVSLDHTWRDAVGLNQTDRLPGSKTNRLAGAAKGVVANDDRRDWTAALELADVDVALVWHGAIFAGEAADNLTAAGFDVLQEIIWNKPIHVLGRSYYHWKHEAAWFARRHGRSVPWLVGRDQVTVWDEASPKHIMSGSHDEKTEHPTQKPVAIYTRPIENHVTRGAGVYDPFAGSGTALIAAHQLGRIAYLMEIDPTYCDVICTRFENATGIAPIKAN
jgi:DNA modification methylase